MHTFCCAHAASAQTKAASSQSPSTTSQTSQFFPPKGTVACSASNPLIAWNGPGNGDTYCTTLVPACPTGQFVTSYDGLTLTCATPKAPACPTGQTADNNGACCAASSIVNGVCGGGGGGSPPPPPSTCPSYETAQADGACTCNYGLDSATGQCNTSSSGTGNAATVCFNAQISWGSCIGFTGDQPLNSTVDVSATQGGIGDVTVSCNAYGNWGPIQNAVPSCQTF